MFEVRGFIAGYGPYASLSWSSGYNKLADAYVYFYTSIDDTEAALVTLVELGDGGWERELDRWRPNPEELAAERDLTLDGRRLVA